MLFLCNIVIYDTFSNYEISSIKAFPFSSWECILYCIIHNIYIKQYAVCNDHMPVLSRDICYKGRHVSLSTELSLGQCSLNAVAVSSYSVFCKVFDSNGFASFFLFTCADMFGICWLGGKLTIGSHQVSPSQTIDGNASELVFAGGLRRFVDCPIEQWDFDEYENEDDLGYIRKTVEDEAYTLAHEIDYLNNNVQRRYEHGMTRNQEDNHVKKDQEENQS